VPGCADIFLVKLEDAVPASDATPAKVLVAAGGGEGARDANILQGKNLIVAGWGRSESGGTPSVRQVAMGRYLRNDDEKLYVRGNTGAITDSGDSGGPAFWDLGGGRRLLVGILQGPTPAANENRYTPTFRRSINGKPSVGDWFSEVVPDAVLCDEALGALERTVPLLSWWSPSRQDNFLTADARWAGCVQTVRSPDYRFVRTEGYLFNPGLPQPPGTVRLYSWFSPDRGDNHTTTHPRWSYWEGGGRTRDPDYRFVRLEGFLFDPDRPQPAATVPLFGWYSPSRGDNWTTGAFVAEGRSGAGLQPDYGSPRLMGFAHGVRSSG
jgi:hypothetical protein